MHDFTLVGQMDSPFVRRVAITMALHGQSFALNPLSVYADFDTLRGLHPLGTVPLLIDAQGTVRSQTDAICAWLDAQATAPLRPPTVDGLQAMGWANTIAAKAGELYRLHRWPQGAAPAAQAVERIGTQLSAGRHLLAEWLATNPPAPGKPGHAEIAVVCGLRFVQMVVSATSLSLEASGTLETVLARHEQHPVFAQCPAS
jgi:glutathione S-transferase